MTGLNDSAVAFGKMSMGDLLAASDWLAIFPSWYKVGLLDEIERRFEQRFTIRVPVGEYTICTDYSQTLMVALQKAAHPPGASRRRGEHPIRIRGIASRQENARAFGPLCCAFEEICEGGLIRINVLSGNLGPSG